PNEQVSVAAPKVESTEAPKLIPSESWLQKLRKDYSNLEKKIVSETENKQKKSLYPLIIVFTIIIITLIIMITVFFVATDSTIIYYHKIELLTFSIFSLVVLCIMFALWYFSVLII